MAAGEKRKKRVDTPEHAVSISLSFHCVTRVLYTFHPLRVSTRYARRSLKEGKL